MSQNNSENPESSPESSLPQQIPTDSPSSSALPDIQIRAEFHAGPLPHPDIMEQYERMQPGTLDRLLTMAETEQQARIDHNTKAGEYKFKVLELRGRNDRSNNLFAHFGQAFGFASVVFYFAILALTVWFDNTTMFTALFCVGAFAGLTRLVRSYQNKNGVSHPRPPAQSP